LEIRRQYLNGFDIKKNFDNFYDTVEEAIIPKDITYITLVEYFKKNKKNKNFNWGVYSTKIEWIDIIEKCNLYYNKVWTDISQAQKMIDNYKPISTNLLKDIQNIFKVNSYYNNTNTKKLLQEVYDKYNIKKVAKATDIKKYFNVTLTKQNNNNVFKIIKFLYQFNSK
ncbi:MAG TPA: hypothetical protein PKD00_05680, partial [Burkholderiales bacterium]|nr:hypothetical protein [Burkholderiales bacterium]